MDSPTISLESIFAQCNEHLREQDKNRDRLIEFYLVLVGALLAAITSAKLDAEAGSILCAFVFLLGLALIYTVTQYRLWHTRYSITSMLLEAFGGPLNDKSLRQHIRSTEQQMRRVAHRMLGIVAKVDSGEGNDLTRGWWGWFRYEIGRGPGTEFATFQAAVLITAVPLFLWLGKLPLYPYSSIGIILIYSLMANFRAAYYLYGQHNKCPWAQWLVNGLDPDWDFCQQQER